MKILSTGEIAEKSLQYAYDYVCKKFILLCKECVY